MNKKLLDKINELGDWEYELMLLSFIRYSMGRRSYIVGACERDVIKLLPVLSDYCLNNIESDLEDYAYDVDNKLKSWGDNCDKNSWLHLWDEVVREIARRKEG